MTTLFERVRETAPPTVSQVTGRPGAKTLAGIDQLLVVLPPKASAATWRRLPEGARAQALMRRSAKGAIPAVRTRLGNKRQTAMYVGTASAAAEAYDNLTFARKLVAAATAEKAGVVGIWVAGFDDDDAEKLASYLLSAALAAAYVLPTYKTSTVPPTIRSIRLLGLGRKLETSRLLAETEGNNIARCLTSLPANKLDADACTDLLRQMASAEGWQYKRYGVSELKKMGAGAFLAVAQGNADDSAAIVRLRYRPGAKARSPDLALVGKGIIFDTGGTNVKPFNSMLDMHIDMGGSAVAVGVLTALTRLGVDLSIDVWLAITENRIGPTAYKPQDVVTALNGKTIQTIHTDAEGRMALADALVLACREKPKAVVDYATLTGACINAVTTRYSGAFTNRPNLHPVLKKCGRESGERVWPFPVGREFLEELKSETADIAQCSPSAGGDHILAASFLNEFVDKTVPWVHIDLSACMRKGGLAHIPTRLTGFGVRFSLALLLDHGLADTEAGR